MRVAIGGVVKLRVRPIGVGACVAIHFSSAVESRVCQLSSLFDSRLPPPPPRSDVHAPTGALVNSVNASVRSGGQPHVLPAAVDRRAHTTATADIDGVEPTSSFIPVVVVVVALFCAAHEAAGLASCVGGIYCSLRYLLFYG